MEVSNEYVIVFMFIHGFICIAFTNINAQNIEFRYDGPDEPKHVGATCRFKLNQSVGVCTNASDCPSALYELRDEHIEPTNCAILGKEPVVCCYSKYYTSVDYVKPPSILFNSPIINSYRKSAIECNRFSEKLVRSPVHAHVGGIKTLEAEFPHIVSINVVQKLS